MLQAIKLDSLFFAANSSSGVTKQMDSLWASLASLPLLREVEVVLKQRMWKQLCFFNNENFGLGLKNVSDMAQIQ